MDADNDRSGYKCGHEVGRASGVADQQRRPCCVILRNPVPRAEQANRI